MIHSTQYTIHSTQCPWYTLHSTSIYIYLLRYITRSCSNSNGTNHYSWYTVHSTVVSMIHSTAIYKIHSTYCIGSLLVQYFYISRWLFLIISFIIFIHERGREKKIKERYNTSTLIHSCVVFIPLSRTFNVNKHHSNLMKHVFYLMKQDFL